MSPSHRLQISDKALAYKNKTTSAPTAADRGSLCFRYDTSCTVVNETSQPSYNEQCVATCSETTQDAVAGPSSSSSSSSSSGVFPTAKCETQALMPSMSLPCCCADPAALPTPLSLPLRCAVPRPVNGGPRGAA